MRVKTHRNALFFFWSFWFLYIYCIHTINPWMCIYIRFEVGTKKNEEKKLCVRIFFGLGICCSFFPFSSVWVFPSLARRWLLLLWQHCKFSTLFFIFQWKICKEFVFFMMFCECAANFLNQCLVSFRMKKVHKSIPYYVWMVFFRFTNSNTHTHTDEGKFLLQSDGFFPSACFLFFVHSIGRYRAFDERSLFIFSCVCHILLLWTTKNSNQQSNEASEIKHLQMSFLFIIFCCCFFLFLFVVVK